MQHRPFSLIPAGLLSVLLAWCLVPLAKADCTYAACTWTISLTSFCRWTCVDWNITEPANGVVWTNGQANLISWSKALDDGVSQFDIELQRLSTSGLSYVAHLGTWISCISHNSMLPCRTHFSTFLEEARLEASSVHPRTFTVVCTMVVAPGRNIFCLLVCSTTHGVPEFSSGLRAQPGMLGIHDNALEAEGVSRVFVQ